MQNQLPCNCCTVQGTPTNETNQIINVHMLYTICQITSWQSQVPLSKCRWWKMQSVGSPKELQLCSRISPRQGNPQMVWQICWARYQITRVSALSGPMWGFSYQAIWWCFSPSTPVDSSSLLSLSIKTAMMAVAQIKCLKGQSPRIIYPSKIQNKHIDTLRQSHLFV